MRVLQKVEQPGKYRKGCHCTVLQPSKLIKDDTIP